MVGRMGKQYSQGCPRGEEERHLIIKAALECEVGHSALASSAHTWEVDDSRGHLP